MLIGYDCKRPEKENYEKFEKKLVSGLNGLGIEGLSLMLYGSYVRKKYDIGRSDIDAVLIFPDDVVTKKRNLFASAKVLAEALRENNIPFQVSIGDPTTIRDGRFNSYMEDFEDYFSKEGKIVVGPDYRCSMKYLELKSNVMHKCSHNLRKARSGLLFSFHDLEFDYENFLRNFRGGLDSAINSTKQIAYLSDMNLRKEKFSSLEFVSMNFPDVDLRPLEIIRHMYKHPRLQDNLEKDPDKVLKLWAASLTTFEQLIREYIKKNPN